jgi:hypothetical protein
VKSFRLIVIVFAAVTSICVPVAHAQTNQKSQHIEISFESCLLRASLLSDHVTGRSDLNHSFCYFRGPDLSAGNYLASYPARMYGLEKYELSPAVMMLIGAGVGAQAGMFAGAVGNTLEWWNEKATWAMVGALSAAGAALFGSKADNPSWRNVYLWEDNHELAPIKR